MLDTLVTYKNSFYSKSVQGSEPVLTSYSIPVDYKGFKIYKRFDNCYDVVIDGVCIAMRAGINGAKKYIDEKNI